MGLDKSGKRRVILWGGFVAATAAALALLVLQYRWQGELESSAALARRAVLNKVLDVASREAFADLKTSAAPVFGLTHADLSDEGLIGLGARLDLSRPPGTRQLFVYSFHSKHPLHVFDRQRRALSIPDYSDETLAIWSAAAPWSVLAKKGAAAGPDRLHFDERDPRHRILLRVIGGPDNAIAGLAGLVIDDTWFAKQALPRAIRSTLSSFPQGDEFAVFVTNESGASILPDAPSVPKQHWTVGRRLTPPFSDWMIAVQDRRSTPERLASRNFVLNMTLSAVLGTLLLGAILLTTRTAAREMRLSSMKSDFVSNVSHELRTPLASIRVFGELMRTGRVSAPEKVLEYGERIETEAMRLSHLVENILDFSRIESGRKAYSFEDTDLAQVVRAGVAACAARVRAAGFRITADVDADLPRLRLDASAIEQALGNILENAVKYSGDAREIAVTAARRGDDVVVSVRDRGIGIPRDEQQRIFERFHRVGGSLVHDVRGVGLGLAIVRHIVEAHQGRVEVESEPGRGSTFSLVLPLGASPAGAPAPSVVAKPA